MRNVGEALLPNIISSARGEQIRMKENIIADKSFDFAVRIVNLHKYLIENGVDYSLARQLLKCGTSIGANVSEAIKAQSTADFYTKLSIALKEANEAHYWLRLLFVTKYLTEQEFFSIEKDVDEIISILVSITKTTKEKMDIK